MVKFWYVLISILSVLLIIPRTEVYAAKVECLTEGNLVFHYHVRVSIILVNDVLEKSQPFTIPPNLGFKSDSCVLEVHTHDNSGTLHIESAAKKEFTVSDLFKYLEEELLIPMKNHDGTPHFLVINQELVMSHWQRIQNLALEDEMRIVVFLRTK